MNDQSRIEVDGDGQTVVVWSEIRGTPLAEVAEAQDDEAREA